MGWTGLMTRQTSSGRAESPHGSSWTLEPIAARQARGWHVAFQWQKFIVSNPPRTVTKFLRGKSGTFQTHKHMLSPSGLRRRWRVSFCVIIMKLIPSYNLQAQAGSEPERFVEVEMQRLDDYVLAQGWSDVHVLKINAEGYDLEILKRGRQLLSSGGIHMLFTKMIHQQLYQRQGGFLDLHAFLTSLDYSLFGCYETASASTGESCWSNGLYVKSVRVGI